MEDTSNTYKSKSEQTNMSLLQTNILQKCKFSYISGSHTLQQDIFRLEHSILEEQSELQRVELAKQIHVSILNLKEIDLEMFVNSKLCQNLFTLIGQRQGEMELLNILNSIADQGAQMAEHWINNTFFIYFQQFIINEMEQFLQKQMKEIKESNKSSEFSISFSQTYFFINKHNRIKDKEVFNFCWKILIDHLLDLINVIKDYEQKSEMNKVEQQDFEDNIQQRMKNGSKSLRAIEGVLEESYNIFNLSDSNLSFKLSPLIHINCDSSIECSQRLIIPYSNAFHELQRAVYITLAEISFNSSPSKLLLIDNQVISHISPIIISFTQNQIIELQSFQSNISKILDINKYSLLVVSGALKLLWSILYCNQTICLIVQSIPNLIKSLIFLTNFQRKGQKEIISIQQTSEIRYWSNACLCFIIKYCDKLVNSIVIEQNFLKIEIEGVGCVGGSEEENNSVIWFSLSNIGQMFNIIILRKQEEDISEENGQNEEIEANIFHKRMQGDDISYQAIDAKKSVQKVHIC